MITEKHRSLIESLALSPEEKELETDDLFEAILFRFKNYFLSKIPIKKLFESKIQQLKKLEKVEELLGLEQKRELVSSNLENYLSIKDSYQSYMRQLNQLKTKMMASITTPEIAHYAMELVKLQKDYASLWHSDTINYAGVLVTQEQDPMRVLEAIKQFEIAGGHTFLQLKQGENNPPEDLLKEQKRLSLLFKKY